MQQGKMLQLQYVNTRVMSVHLIGAGELGVSWIVRTKTMDMPQAAGVVARLLLAVPTIGAVYIYLACSSCYKELINLPTSSRCMLASG